ncbi:MAG: alpha/beta hydrolase [Clostridia bacterium]|nr:alpha/beta hydrolase [Clostridia bacterium]
MKCWTDINYTIHDDDRRRLDIFAPEGECRATVLWTHGGGLEAGNRKGFDGIAAQLCGEGVGFVSVEYRMYPDFVFPTFVEDNADAAAWLVEHAAEYGLSDKIFIGGSSAGGYLTMMLCFARRYLEKRGLTPERFAGYIFDAGQPTTHFNILRHRGEDPRLCRIDEAAPLWHVTDARPGRPVQVIYADNDMPARPQQNELLLATMRHFGYDMSLVRVKLMEGYGHCGYDYEQKDGKWVLAGIIGDFVNSVV